jgi:hypothetical protein
MLAHMQRFYDLLDSKAENSDEGGRVYTGQITADFNSLELPSPYYSRMTRVLQQMGCMTQLQRGGRANPSRWALHFRPTEESYGQVDPREGNMNSLNEQIRIYQSSQDQKLRGMARKQAHLESRVEHLTTALLHNASLVASLYASLNLALPQDTGNNVSVTTNQGE